MSTVIVIAYPNRATANRALARLEKLQELQLITIDDAVIARHLGDKIKLDQATSLTGTRATTGALWGGLLGLLFAAPIAGAAVGLAAGALVGKLSDYGIDDGFAKEMGAKVTRGKVALVLLASSHAPDRVVAEMQKGGFGGELLQTSLSMDDEAKLRALANGI